MLFVIDEAAIVIYFNVAKQLSHFLKTDFDNLPKEGCEQLSWNSWWVKNKHWPWMYSEVFLTQFWPTCGMVRFTSERLISSWYTYKIHIIYLLSQVWNKIIAYTCLPTKVKKWDIDPKPCAFTKPRTRKAQKLRFGTFRIKGGFFIAKFITID